MYRVIPAPMHVEGKSADAYAGIMNQAAQEGFRFIQVITVTETTGCMFNKKTSSKNLLIFVRA